MSDVPHPIRTIEDLAEVLHLSKSTVSRAFRDSYDINPVTKQKILNAAVHYGFEPNSTAQSLRENKTRRIGVIIPSFTIPFYSIAICGIQQVARAEGYNLLICESDECYNLEVENVAQLLKSRVDGIIMSVTQETTRYTHITQLRQQGTPLVMFNRTTNLPGISKVRVDDYDGAFKMTNHLLAKGYKCITYLAGPKELMMTQQRVKGFRDAMYINHIDVQIEEIAYGDFSVSHGRDMAEALLAQPSLPEAIFCSCDNVAFGVINRLKEAGIRIPDDVAVAGYTDEPFAAFIDPPLTTIRQPMREIGAEAAHLLFKQLRYCHTRPEIHELPTTLIERGSA